MIAIVQFGILLGIYHYYQSQNTIKPSRYWLKSLLTNVVALSLFGVGILVIDDISKPPFSFTIANSLFYASSVMQTLFCISLNNTLSIKKEKIYVASIFLFPIFFDYLRQTSNFETRTIVMVSFVSLFYLLQIIEINKCSKTNPSKQIGYLQYTTAIELIFALSRIGALIINDFGIKHVEQLPQLLVLATLAQLVMNTLAYISATGYWAEKISFSNAKTIAESEARQQKLEEITALLNEKERLAFSLLRANKTALTGALSTSIAHELNQPLTATTLNLQLLKRLLAAETINIETCKDIVNSIEVDVKRSSTIIKSLRSIFKQDDANLEEVKASDLIREILEISKKELIEKNIEVILNVDENLKLKVYESEFRQVLLNLISNSIQALSASQNKPKTINIHTELREKNVSISISDNGHGIDKEFQPNLFELLSTTKQTGMGVGLWLCKHIVDRHKGKIWYEDIGTGAKFVIEVPAE